VQRTLYKEVVEPTIDDILNGYNGTVFTYGQSGSGKTYTMFGDDIWDDDKKGVIPRSM
jgi:kinesin family protein 5